MKVSEFDKHLKKARGHISRNVEITMKINTIVRKPFMKKASIFVNLESIQFTILHLVKLGAVL